MSLSLERRITFIIGQEGFAAWKLNRLKALSSYFGAVVMLKNITHGKTANAENTLQVMSMGCKQNDLCQLWIEGSDAELACMVLTDFVADEFDIVNTAHRSRVDFSDQVIRQHSAFNLPFALDYYYQELPRDTEMNKNAILMQLTKQLDNQHQDMVYHLLQQREQVSSTCIGHAIALPHIMCSQVERPLLSVLRLGQPTDWHSVRGDVTLVICLLLPTPPQAEVIRAFTQVSRTLLNEEFCYQLTSTMMPEALKAILIHTMAKPSA